MPMKKMARTHALCAVLVTGALAGLSIPSIAAGEAIPATDALFAQIEGIDSGDVPNPGTIRSQRPGSDRPSLPDFAGDTGEVIGILPPLELPGETGLERLFMGLRFALGHVEFTGTAAIETEELNALAKPYLGKVVGIHELRQLRDLVTQHYIELGYVTSGAELPDQEIADGRVELRITEGTLSELDVATDGRLRDAYLRAGVGVEAGDVVNVYELEERLRLLQQDVRVESVRSNLIPTKVRGLAKFEVFVTESRAYHLGAESNNYRPPSIGSIQGVFKADHQNVTGFGDAIEVSYSTSEGLHEVLASYEIPLGRWATSIEAHYLGSWAEVTQEPFDSLDIDSEAYTVGFLLNQPVHRTPASEVGVFAIGEQRRSETTILDTCVELVKGPSSDCVSRVTALRFGSYWNYRTPQTALALRNTLSIGLDLFNAAQNESGTPDGEFVSWLGQALFAQRLPWLDAQILARFDIQVSDKPLLGLEQFGVGGMFTVRGYRENQVVFDNGLTASIEARIPVWSSQGRRFALGVAPFFDIGHAWDHDSRDVNERSSETLASIGIGLRADITRYGFAQVYWGQELDHIVDPGDYDIQDSGFHFRVGLTY